MMSFVLRSFHHAAAVYYERHDYDPAAPLSRSAEGVVFLSIFERT
ncbi:hypothetical protein [Litorimonas taeanensis]|nr:hypothetical protein [Litorimonas taeanensis]